jgi:hypothetical protein
MNDDTNNNKNSSRSEVTMKSHLGTRTHTLDNGRVFKTRSLGGGFYQVWEITDFLNPVGLGQWTVEPLSNLFTDGGPR